jgi:hypothetical protein
MAITQPDSLSAWNSSSFLQAIAQELQIASAQNIVQLTPGATSGNIPGISSFALLLTAAADVDLTTAGGQSLTVSLPAGYQPIRVSNVAAVSTGTAYGLY